MSKICVASGTKCSTCNLLKARCFPCGHTHHVACLTNRKQCNTCNQPIKLTDRKKSDRFADARQTTTVGVNGNVFITVNQNDEWGRTTITREIKKNKIQEYQKVVLNNKDNKINGNLNIGLQFMQSLMDRGNLIRDQPQNHTSLLLRN